MGTALSIVASRAGLPQCSCDFTLPRFSAHNPELALGCRSVTDQRADPLGHGLHRLASGVMMNSGTLRSIRHATRRGVLTIPCLSTTTGGDAIEEATEFGGAIADRLPRQSALHTRGR